jgi:hypothetical protein
VTPNRQQSIDDGVAEALRDYASRKFDGQDPFDSIKRSVLKKVPDATSDDFQQAAHRWVLNNREFGQLVIDLAFQFAVPTDHNETVRTILKRADANGSTQAKTLLSWFPIGADHRLAANP